MLVDLIRLVFWLVSGCVLLAIAYSVYNDMRYGNRVAPKGKLYVCSLCGRMSRDKHGEQAISKGWDASCTLDAVLKREDSLIIVGDRVFTMRCAENYRANRENANNDAIQW